MDIEKLLCPFCGDNLRIGDVYSEKNGEIVNGYAYCHCGEYPIVSNILYLRKDDLNFKIIEKVKRNSIIEATLTLMRMPENSHLWFKKIDSYSFFNLTQKNDFGNYLKHRFSSETFWLIYPCILMADKMGNNEKILDLACGTGHSSYVIYSYLEPEELVCADINFWHLFLLKKFFVDDAFCVCIDANSDMAFENGYFDYINMMDAFHSVQNKNDLSRELVRILDSNGVLSLPHLHNSLQFNYGGDDLKGLTPQEWTSLFRDLYVKAIPDESLLSDFLFLDKLDMSIEYSIDELNSSNSITIVGDNNPSIYEMCIDGIWKYIINKKLNLIVNPIYEIEYRNNHIVLKRQFPSEFFRKNYPITEKYLPERYVIKSDIRKFFVNRSLLLDKIDEKSIFEIEEMMKKFILINTPSKYTF